MSTVNEVLTQTVNIMDTLELKEIVCVFDQALYAKAPEITWKHEKFKNLILRMGAFHTICNLLSTIGKRFQDAGLRDLCVEYGVIAEGSITAVMEGRKYNRAVRLHKIVYEAMMRLAWKGFLPWIQVNHGVEAHHLEEALRSISTFHDEVSQASFTELMDDISLTRILQLFQEYIDSLRNGHPLAAFWVSYLNMAEIMLGLLRAAREGDWLLHLASIRAMIPWCIAYGLIMHASSHTTMPPCHICPLITQKCTNSSCRVASASSLAARFPSAGSRCEVEMSSKSKITTRICPPK